MNVPAKISRDDLLAELQRLAETLDRAPETDDMLEDGQFSTGPFYNEFGSWNDALREASLEVNHPTNIGGEDLLKELRQLHDRLGRVPKEEDMRQEGAYSAEPYKRRFGSWTEALEQAGFDPHIHQDLDKAKMVDYLQTFAEELGHRPKRDEMTDQGDYGANSYVRTFGSWNEALRQAGLGINQEYSVSKTDLARGLRRLANNLDRTPSRNEMDQYGTYSHFAYEDKFGSWNTAVESVGLVPTKTPAEIEPIEVECSHCGEVIERQPNEIESVTNAFCSRQCLYRWMGDQPSDRKTKNYGHGFTQSLKKKVRKRDGNVCQNPGCSVSQEEHLRKYGHSLHVHHIRPPEMFDDPSASNTLDNLTALCVSCHSLWERMAPLTPVAG